MLYRCTLHDDVSAAELDVLAGTMPAERRARFDRYRRYEDKVSCVMVWMLLRYAVAHEPWIAEQAGLPDEAKTGNAVAAFLCGPEAAVRQGAFGKPAFAGGSVQFNLSHTDGAVLCAVDRAPVGCDVERTARFGGNKDLLERRVLHANERAVLARAGKMAPAIFCAFWTLKEAHVKQAGCGLSLDLTQLDFSAAAPLIAEGGKDRAAKQDRAVACSSASFDARSDRRCSFEQGGLRYALCESAGRMFAACSVDALEWCELDERTVRTAVLDARASSFWVPTA